MIDRYTLSKMGNIWSEKHKMEIMLKIEVLACEAMSKLGLVPKKALEKIKKNAQFNIDEVKKLEEKTKHDVVAFINNVGKSLGPEARYLHMGLPLQTFWIPRFRPSALRPVIFYSPIFTNF